ncbi:hypothetical protein PCC7418_1584 [Halothece sp. PCC 7418]|uniref:hypothetical protein n=1 Tax=Halothece sp. (strain PCC 7418) TaxID=65093 RepID=UPI0002A05D3F|nr:hypothetical protein [Halothece sp. PCC 7418]AFZ43770.1 hypothetical protein PCC7418_1584 [Halothece sp. PCC 7418]
MFRSQVIKCYELPYCTLEILRQDRFRLVIESFDLNSEPTFQISSDRAHLISLAQTVQKQLQSVHPPGHQPLDKQPAYPVHWVIEDQSYSTQLSWGQLSDLAKILDQYQTDVEKNPSFNGNTQKYMISLIALLFIIMGGIIARAKIHPQPLKTEVQSSSVSPPENSTASSSATASETPPTLSPLPPSPKRKLKLSDSLAKLDQLSPPASITIPTPVLTDRPSLPPPQPIPDPISPPPQPQFQESDIPARKQVNLPTKPQPETLFDHTPQVAQIRKYFQSRWNPPENLKQDIEYQMIINSNGSLEKIIPLGTVAQNYVSLLPFPKLNQDFVSASPTQTQQNIRLVFRPSGQVETFLIHEN